MPDFDPDKIPDVDITQSRDLEHLLHLKRILKKSIEYWYQNLSENLITTLEAQGVVLMEDLVSQDESKLSELGLDGNDITEINEFLTDIGLSLGQDTDTFYQNLDEVWKEEMKNIQ